MNCGKRQLPISPNENKLQSTPKKFQNMASGCGDVFSWDGMSNMLDSKLNEKLKDVAKKEDLVVIREELEAVKAENNNLKREVKQLTSKMEMIDRKTRSANIVVNGLKNSDALAAKNEFAKLCTDVLEVDLSINNTSVMGKNTVMFSLESTAAVQRILGAKRKLKGRTIYIQRDYTTQEQHSRYILRQIVKKLKSKNKTLDVKLGEFSIFLNNKKFVVKNDRVIAFSEEDLNFLKKTFEKCECNYEIVLNDQKTNINNQ